MTSLAPVSEDDIIKKRLLIEGDSGNEDRLINKLIKNFVKWSSHIMSSDTVGQENATNGATNATADDENIESLHEQTIASLSHAEFGLFRNQFILDMNKMEQDNYEELYKRINSEIERAQKKIVESKVDLLEARKIRKNRQEYDILARQILNFPNRVEMQATIKTLEERVEQLKKSEYEYDRKIDLRRKQFSVVLQSLSSLKMLIETDSKLDLEYINSGSMSGEDAPFPVEHSEVITLSSSSKAIHENQDDADDDMPKNEKRSKTSSSSIATTDEIKMEES